MAKAPGLVLRGWLAATRVAQPFLRHHLKTRLKRGKEHPDRWREKLGLATQQRPEGKLVWLHAVGLGEVLALRGLISRLSLLEPDLNFLVTSGTRTSAEVFARNLPPRTIHQFLPLDAPGPAKRFLEHWHPDLSIWAEQELWPGLVYRADQAGIPLALVNARMNAAAFARRQKAAALYRDVLPRFGVVSAQDDRSAEHLATLGAPVVSSDGSLKPLAPPLADDPEKRRALETAIGDRPFWLAASTHADDEMIALSAHARLLQADPGMLMILAPRFPDRAPGILETIANQGFTVVQRSTGQPITPDTQVYLADTIGELGVFYRLAGTALIGGTMGDVEGHNPWEAVQLSCAVLHGPRTANFAADYAALQGARAARLIETPEALASAIIDPEAPELVSRGTALIRANMDRLDHLCQKLLDLL